MGGGGGVSGAVAFPAYIEALHEDWIYGSGPSALTTTLEAAMNVAFGADPYASASISNPSTLLAQSKTQFDNFYSQVTSLVETTDFASFIDQAVSKADECDIDGKIDIRTILNRQISEATRTTEEAMATAKLLAESTVISDLIATFEVRQATSRAKRVTQFSASMADIGAIHSSAYLMGLGMIYAQEQEDSDTYAAQVSAQIFEQGIRTWLESYVAGLRTDTAVQVDNKAARERRVLTGLDVLFRMQHNKLNLYHASAQMLTEQNRIRILAEQEYDSNVIDMDVQSALWDMDVFGRGISVVGALSGYAHPLPEKPSKASSVLGGAMGGAAAGAALGPIGAIGGAVLGGVAGLLT